MPMGAPSGIIPTSLGNVDTERSQAPHGIRIVSIDACAGVLVEVASPATWMSDTTRKTLPGFTTLWQDMLGGDT